MPRLLPRSCITLLTLLSSFFFFFNDTATTEIYTLSLHDALPISSRNFYVSFLAALEVDRNPEKYFGSLQRQSAVKFQEVQLPAYVSMPTLERALRIEPEKLRALNPALTHAVWDGRQRVPKAYRLRLPLDGTSWTRELLAQRLSPGEMFAGQSAPP